MEIILVVVCVTFIIFILASILGDVLRKFVNFDQEDNKKESKK